MKIVFLSFFMFSSACSFSQHHHEQVPAKKDSVSQKNDMPGMNMNDTVPKNKKGMDETQGMNHHMRMSHVYSLNLPMGRNGSGTSWLPDVSPMYAFMFHKKDWMFLLHEKLFILYNDQTSIN